MADLVGAGATIGASILGNVFASDDQQRAEDARKAALNQYLGIHVPTIEEQQVHLQQLKRQGNYDPRMEGTVNQGDSQMAGIQTDPRLRSAQMQALAQMHDLGNTGLSATDRMELGNIHRSAEGDANAASQAVMQNMSARGMGGGGAELAARLSGAQGAANRASQQGDQIASMAQQKALQAISQSGQLATGMQSNDFSQKAQQAQAQDYINHFNTANRQSVNNRNTFAANQGQQYNLNDAQRIADRNAGIQNEQEMHNKGLYQGQFNNAMGKAYGASGQYGQLSGYYGNQADATRGMWANIGQGIGGMSNANAAGKKGANGGFDPSSMADGSVANEAWDGGAGAMSGGSAAGGGALGSAATMAAFADGGMVPGQAAVPGDNPANDTVTAKLSPGEVVVPRSKAHDPDKAKAFIEHILKRR